MACNTLRLLATFLVPWLVGAVAQAAPRNQVQGVTVETTPDGRVVRIRTTSEPTFTVFRLSDPMRVVIDISGGDLSKLEVPITIEDGVVDQIAGRQFAADGFTIGRLIVGFTRTLTYDVQAQGSSVVIRTGTALGATVTEAAPPPMAPVDRVAAERFETARKEADLAAARAAEERKRAEAAAVSARDQQGQAEKVGREAEHLRQEAERAKAEADTLRRQANEAITKDRARAETAAKEAEAKVIELQQAAVAVARSRADAERLAAEADRKRLEAAEVSARAEAKHKLQVAEVAEQVARAQQEKRAAETAHERAQAAKAEAEQARETADQARLAVEKARGEIDAKLNEIARRDRLAQAALQALAGEKQAVLAERQLVLADKQAVESQRQRIAADKQAVENQRRVLEGRAQEVADKQAAIESEKKRVDSDREAVENQRRALDSRAREMSDKQAAIEAEKKRVAAVERATGAAQQKIDADRKTLLQAQAELTKAEKEREKHAAGVRKATTQEIDTLQAERERLEALKRTIDESQAQVKSERQSLGEQEQRLAEMQKEQAALAKQTAELKREREALEKKRQAVELLEARARKAKPTPAAKNVAIDDPEATPEVAINEDAGMGNTVVAAVAQMPTSSSRASVSTRAHLVGVERRGSGDDAGVLLLLDRTPRFDAQRLSSPPRLVLDLVDTDRRVSRATYGVKSPFVRRVRLGDHGGSLRVVLDLSSEAQHSVTPTPDGLLVTMSPTVAEATPPMETPKTRMAAAAPESTAASKADALVIRDVRFSGNNDSARVIVELPKGATARVDDRSPKAWVLEIKGAVVPKNLERALDTSAYGSVVRLVSTYQASTDPAVVNVVANLSGPATQTLTEQSGMLVWDIAGQAKPTTVASAATPQTAGFAAEAVVVATSTPTQTRHNKKKISIDLKDADIVNVLRLLAEVSGENIVTSDDVKGKVTLRLRDVPWDQALDTILKSKGYDKVRQNNIMRIAPADKIRLEKEQELLTKKAKEQIEETVIKMITINYATAADIVGQIKPLLTGRGSVQPESRTNTIILEDLASNIDRMVELIRRLDKQTPQVLIEARIVEASSNNADELGIQWGGTGQATAQQGNPTGLQFPGDVTVSGAADSTAGNQSNGTSTPGRYAVNLPAAIGAGAGGGLGFIFGSAGGGQLLNLRISALESNGRGRIISSPRITTLDNKTAKISQGVDIPITVVSAAGANTRFVPAALELEVTPHVTNDGSVLLKIKTSKNEPSQSLKGAQGDPAIEKKYAETEVLVRDGDTTVIGGIYTRSTSEAFAGVPFLSDIPVIGWLFKKRSSTDQRAELLVFITPRIVNREESSVQAASLPGKVVEQPPK
jgi:type IV pilus assembly protein PilQ